ncbi:MAG: hypothetical protein HYY17_00700 [Planctomycetes bacterium]|nr:hypothetical protein [Planctomycetota bacterium]
MNLTPLFTAIDQKPFRPFEIGLTSGERIPVTHLENLFLIPNRQAVGCVIVCQSEAHPVLIWPEALATVRFNGDTERLDGPGP